MSDQRDPPAAEVVPASERHAPDRAGARAQRLRRRRVGAAVRESDRRAERLGGADQRADVAGVGDVPERERRVALLPRPGDPRAGRRRPRAADAACSPRLRAASARRPRRPRAGRRAAPSPQRPRPRPRRRTARASRASACRAACARASGARCPSMTITAPTPATRRGSRGRRGESDARRDSAASSSA